MLVEEERFAFRAFLRREEGTDPAADDPTVAERFPFWDDAGWPSRNGGGYAGRDGALALFYRARDCDLQDGSQMRWMGDLFNSSLNGPLSFFVT